MHDLKEQKRLLRAEYKILRRTCNGREADQRITDRLMNTEEYRKAALLLTYVSSGSEPDTLCLIVRSLADGKKVACPRCSKETHSMTFHEIGSLADLSPGSYGLFEPQADAPEVNPDELGWSLCVVPGLSFDASGSRLGYGGGYYDRFLAGWQGTAVGLCREETFSDQPLPQDLYDVGVDMVVTEQRTLFCRDQ